jgi:poly-D-alanine transfer protein DltD
MKKIIIIGSVVVIALAVVLFFVFKNSDSKQKFVTDKIARGNIKSTVPEPFKNCL